MKYLTSRRTTALAAVLALTVTVSGIAVQTAQAAGDSRDAGPATDDCTPSDAWTETIPAQGEEHILVPNPDYVPEVPEVSHTVHHPAQTATEYHRYSWNASGQQDPGDATPATDDRWQLDNKSKPGDDPIGVKFQQSNGASASWLFWEAEEVVVSEAWDEKVIDQEYVPAQGEEQILVDNPAYVAEQVVEHPAVVCPVSPVDPGTVEPISPYVPVTPEAPVTPTAPATPDASDVPAAPVARPLPDTGAPQARPAAVPVVHVNG